MSVNKETKLKYDGLSSNMVTLKFICFLVFIRKKSVGIQGTVGALPGGQEAADEQKHIYHKKALFYFHIVLICMDFAFEKMQMHFLD